jgi:hypothetical protein
MQTDQVRERLDSGDVHGAVRLILKNTIGEVKKGIPAQETNSLSALQEKAANEFFARHPEIELQVTADSSAAFEFGNRMAIAVRSLGLDGTQVSHWEAGYKVEQANRPAARPRQETAIPAAPASQPAATVDELSQAAQDLIESYGGTRGFKEFFDGLTAKQMENEMRSLKFQRAVELTFPQNAPSLLTRGDYVNAAQALRMAEISGTDPRELERAIVVSRDLHAQAYANYQERPAGPEGGKPHWGPSFANRQNAQSGRRTMTAAEAKANELANAARSRQPEKSRADAVREAQELEAKAKQERWSR